jgi:hypothetical protein
MNQYKAGYAQAMRDSGDLQRIALRLIQSGFGHDDSIMEFIKALNRAEEEHAAEHPDD